MSRITPGTMIVIIFAILFGLVGAYAARRYFEQKPQVVEKKSPPVVVDPFINVPLASTNLPVGRELKLGDIAVYRVKTSESKKYTHGLEYMANPQQIIGRIVQKAMKKGDVFQSESLYPEGTGPSIAERLKPGFRAKTIGVRGTGILSGLAPPGAMVDVLFRTNETPTKEIPEATVTLLHGVEVLAVQENTAPNGKNTNTPANVTLAVSPSQANALTIVEGRGEFSLALRGDNEDAGPVNVDPQTLEGLLGIKRRPPPLPKPQPQRVEVYRGTSRGVLVFDNGDVFDDSATRPPVNTNPRPVTLPPQVPDAVLPPQIENLIPKNLD